MKTYFLKILVFSLATAIILGVTACSSVNGGTEDTNTTETVDDGTGDSNTTEAVDDGTEDSNTTEAVDDGTEDSNTTDSADDDGTEDSNTTDSADDDGTEDSNTTDSADDDGTEDSDTTDDSNATVVVQSYGSAALSGTLAESTTVAGASTRSVVEIDSEASAELIVDLNDNGIFGDSEDIKYTAIVGTEGAFEFQAIKVSLEGLTEVQLTVSKKGFAPVTKIISLTDGQNSSVVAEAAAMPVYTQVIAIDRSGTATQGSYLKIGMKNTSSGVSSYAKIMSLSQLRAEAANPSFGEDDLSTSVIPLDAVPDDVTEIRADMKAFDPTDPEDSKYFPGEYKGEGKGDSTEDSRLVSVGFDLVSLQDQNGDQIELDKGAIQTSKLRPQAITWENCLQTKIRYLGATQVALIENMGDDDDTTSKFEIPMWYYNSGIGIWSYLGDAEYVDAATSTNGRAYANMCITENWGKYLNLDYDFTITEPKTVCLNTKDQYNQIVNNMTVTLRKDTAYSYAYLDADGKAKVSLTAGNDIATYDMTYSGYMTGWTGIQVDTTGIVPNTSDDDCDYDFNLIVQNPYTTTLRVSPLDINGSIGKDIVYVSNNSYREYFNEGQYADEDGVATFNVKPNTSYTVRYRSATVSVNANGALVAPETADSTRALSVTVSDVNLAPSVYVRFEEAIISEKATTAKFYMITKDKNGDAITLESLTLNGVPLVEGTHYTIRNRYQGTNYDNFYGVLNLDNAAVSVIVPSSLNKGNYTLSATYSDGVVSATASSTLEVIGNLAPVINGVYFYADTGYVNLRDVIPSGTYTISAYAYDPNGDTVSLTYSLDGAAAVTTASVELADGTHTIVVNASDGNLTTSKSFTAFVGNHPPVVTYAGVSSNLVDIASADNEINLFAYVNDKEDGSQVKSVQAVDQNGTVYPFTFNLQAWKYEMSMTPAFVGIYTFNITATDNNDTNSTVYSVNVQTIQNNQAPTFTVELTSAVIDVDTTETFTCEAEDYEGTFITYNWMVGGVAQSTTATTLTKTFDVTGQIAVSCTAIDEDGESSTSNALMTVIDPTQVGTLVVNTQMQGLVVAIHDMTTMEPIDGEQALTDASGSATFNIVGDRTTFSVSLTSDTAMSGDVLMDIISTDLVNSAAFACSVEPDTNTTCASVDWCVAYDSVTIPNWMVDLNPPRDENGSIIATADEIDTNNDGAVDASELQAIVLQMDDANDDGEVTWSEFNGGDQMITSQLYSMVPVREYNLEFSGYNTESYFEYADGCADTTESFSEFNLTITDYPSDTREYMTAQGNGYGSYHSNSDENGSLTFKVSAYSPNADGNYSYLVTNNNNYYAKEYYLLEGNASVLQAGVSISADDFVAPTEYNVTTDEDNNFAVTARYNNIWYSGSYLRSTDFGYTDGIFSFSDAEYVITTFKYVDVSGVGEVEYSTSNYYGDGTLQTSYVLSDYPEIDVSISAVDGSFEFGGSELSKVNLVESSLILYGDSFNANVNVISTQAASRMDDINLSKILPSSVLAAIDDLDLAYEMESSTSLTEYKDKTETELLDMFVYVDDAGSMESISRAVLESEVYWYDIPNRSLNIYGSGFFEEGGFDGEDYFPAAPSRKQTDEPKKTTMKKPFSIGLDVSKAW